MERLEIERVHAAIQRRKRVRRRCRQKLERVWARSLRVILVCLGILILSVAGGIEQGKIGLFAGTIALAVLLGVVYGVKKLL